MTDMLTWIHDNDDKFYNVAKYVKVFTPYQQQKAYMDESKWEWEKTCKIKEAIELPNDVLLGLQEYVEYEDVLEDNTIVINRKPIFGIIYVRLSDIQIEDVTNEID